MWDGGFYRSVTTCCRGNSIGLLQINIHWFSVNFVSGCNVFFIWLSLQYGWECSCVICNINMSTASCYCWCTANIYFAARPHYGHGWTAAGVCHAASRASPVGLTQLLCIAVYGYQQFCNRLTPFGSILHGLTCALDSHVIMLDFDLDKVDCKLWQLLTCMHDWLGCIATRSSCRPWLVGWTNKVATKLPHEATSKWDTKWLIWDMGYEN